MNYRKLEKNDLIQLSILKYIDNCQLFDKVQHEKYIAQNLDKFILTYPNELQQVPINSLYNIFNHKEKSLTDQNKAYEFIMLASNHNKNVFILLESLDESKLNSQILLESLIEAKAHFGFHPKIFSSSFFTSIKKEVAIDEVKKFKTINQQLIIEKVSLQQKKNEK